MNNKFLLSICFIVLSYFVNASLISNDGKIKREELGKCGPGYPICQSIYSCSKFGNCGDDEQYFAEGCQVEYSGSESECVKRYKNNATTTTTTTTTNPVATNPVATNPATTITITTTTVSGSKITNNPVNGSSQNGKTNTPAIPNENINNHTNNENKKQKSSFSIGIVPLICIIIATVIITITCYILVRKIIAKRKEKSKTISIGKNEPLNIIYNEDQF